MTDTRPRLLIMSYSHLFRDARLLRQIKLFSTEYAVTTCGYGPAPEGVVAHHEIPGNITAKQLDRSLLLTRRFQQAYDRLAITRHVRGVLGNSEFDVILANDVDTVPIAVGLKPVGGVHADLHEYATRQQEEFWRFRWFIAPYLAFLIRRYVRQADSVTTVGAQLAKEYEREFGVPCGIVLNAPHRADLPVGPVGDPIRLVHAGGATPARLDTMLAAMDLVRTDTTLDLFLVDSGGGYVEQVRQRFAGHPRVAVHDAVPTEALVATLNAFDVGIHILPPISFNHRYAMPNKLFDFVQARLGVLTGPSPEMAALVREHDIGFVTADFTPEAVARQIEALTPDTVQTVKENSDRAAELLCAEEQVVGWTTPVKHLADRAARRAEPVQESTDQSG
ncbi:glycosyltransferase family 1 protein [Ornithinimicrobium sp. F0845]|uniref:glycosyltransferase family 1 protein n=1 Tax=Ornithinimicrobium sp. F0845 TaxID=2926412 RepID=UPI001FF4F420|nr:glycosyltransferase family 1 protein [Ornithinimicrobium sp. F0845]MCK0111847.1 glycosyltransferase family 1 protein [Ornithinimicrobium sp. F0845]